MQSNINSLSDGGETIKQAYSSLLKNNFVSQQLNTPSNTIGD
jgi:hypothetical protein